MSYFAGYSYAYNNPLVHTDVTGLCVGIEGSPQDRPCTFNDYYWDGIPGAFGEAFTAAWAGASDGVGFNVSMLVDCTSYNKYKDNSAYWVGDEVGLAAGVLTLTAAADPLQFDSGQEPMSVDFRLSRDNFVWDAYHPASRPNHLAKSRSPSTGRSICSNSAILPATVF